MSINLLQNHELHYELFQNSRIRTVHISENVQYLQTCSKMNIHSQRSVLIQPRTSSETCAVSWSFTSTSVLSLAFLFLFLKIRPNRHPSRRQNSSRSIPRHFKVGGYRQKFVGNFSKFPEIYGNFSKVFEHFKCRCPVWSSPLPKAQIQYGNQNLASFPDFPYIYFHVFSCAPRAQMLSPSSYNSHISSESFSSLISVNFSSALSVSSTWIRTSRMSNFCSDFLHSRFRLPKSVKQIVDISNINKFEHVDLLELPPFSSWARTRAFPEIVFIPTNEVSTTRKNISPRNWCRKLRSLQVSKSTSGAGLAALWIFTPEQFIFRSGK